MGCRSTASRSDPAAIGAMAAVGATATPDASADARNDGVGAGPAGAAIAIPVGMGMRAEAEMGAVAEPTAVHSAGRARAVGRSHKAASSEVASTPSVDGPLDTVLTSTAAAAEV